MAQFNSGTNERITNMKNQQLKLQAVILTAGRAHRLWPLTLTCPKVLLSVGGKPAIFHMLVPLLRRGVYDFTFIVSPNNKHAVETVIGQCLDGAGVTLRYIEQTDSLGPGHAFSLSHDVIIGPTLLLLADTLCSLPEEYETDWIGVAPFEPGTHSHWCTVDLDNFGVVQRLIDKPEALPATNQAAVGIYFFKDPAALRLAMLYSQKADERLNEEFQLSSILNRYMNAFHIKAMPINSWRDLGTLQGYSETVRDFLPRRFFTHLAVSAAGYLSKRSSFEEIKDEISWFSKVPEKEGRLLAPRLLQVDADGLGYCTEYLDYPTLSELFTYGFVTEEAWTYIFYKFLQIMNNTMWSHYQTIDNIETRCQSMYIDKTLKRLSQWERQDLLTLKAYVVNGNQIPGFHYSWRSIHHLMQNLIQTGNEHTSFIHGDLSFGNILYSTRSSVFRLVDPRGNFGASDPIGDNRYDAAKLRQCYHGCYDILTADLFHIKELKPGHFDFYLYPAGLPNPDLFDHQLTQIGFNSSELELIEALLFFSMIPFHKDAPERQLGFFLIALQCLQRFL